jgi:hypothetical protein
LTVALSNAGAAALHIERADTNVWWAWFGTGRAEEHGASTSMPSTLLDALPRGADAVTLAKVELDTCGAWVTLANAEHARPIVVRRAGWVDVRGHPNAGGAHADDRVGLGPGDSLVLARPDSCDTATDEFLDALLAAAATPDAVLDAAVKACGHDDAAVAVLGVPADLGADPPARVAAALGVAVADLALPGYPLGDLQPELWSEPPRPPRLARMRLSRENGRVRDIRQLLDRLIASWRLTSRVDEGAVKLAASELASNALVHSPAPEAATVRYLGDVVRIEVDDASVEPPSPRQPDPTEIGGHGLQVIDKLATSWGFEPRRSGKRVWFEMAVRP